MLNVYWLNNIFFGVFVSRIVRDQLVYFLPSADNQRDETSYPTLLVVVLTA